MKIIKSTGLVPVRSLADGSIFGVPPKSVLAGLEAKKFELVVIPDEIDTIETADPVRAPPKEPAKPAEEIAIPEGWAELHHIQIWKLAVDLVGKDQIIPQGDETKTDAARRIIAAEVDRRAASE